MTVKATTLHYLELAEVAVLIRHREISSREVTQSQLDRMASLDGELGEQPGLIAMLQRYTCPFDMSGHPTLTLPGGYTQEGMPVGFQLVAGHLGEAVLIRAGVAFQGISAWHRRHPVV